MYIVHIKLASVTAVHKLKKSVNKLTIMLQVQKALKKNQCIEWTLLVILLDNKIFIKSAPFLKVGKLD